MIVVREDDEGNLVVRQASEVSASRAVERESHH